MRPPPVMLFAAGFGTRMGALTKYRPKPLIEVAGRKLIDHTLGRLREAGCDRVVVNLHYLPEAMEAHLKGQAGITTLREAPYILDTGGGLRNALPLLDAATVITSTSDAIWIGPPPLPPLLKAWDEEHMDGLMMTVPLARAIGRQGSGDFSIDGAGRLSRKGDAVYGGLQIIKTPLLEEVEEEVFSLNRLWDLMIDRGRLFGLSYPGGWCDIGHPEGIALAEAALAQADV